MAAVPTYYVRLVQLDDATGDLGAALLGHLPAPFHGGELVQRRPAVATCVDPVRGQVDALRLIDLVDPPAGDRWVVLGLTGYDLYISALSYVFGLSELGARRGVLSWARLDPGADAIAPDQLVRRLRIEAAHELGHAVGLIHCPVPTCPMHRTLWPEAVELKEADYCPTCREQVDAGMMEAAARGG